MKISKKISTVIISLGQFILFISCNHKTELRKEFLFGKSAIETVDIEYAPYIDTSIIQFNKNGMYIRIGEMYIQNEGKYNVRNDTLEIHYACFQPCDKNTCGVQRYVIMSDGKLHLVSMRTRDGEIIDLSNTRIDKILELK